MRDRVKIKVMVKIEPIIKIRVLALPWYLGSIITKFPTELTTVENTELIIVHFLDRTITCSPL